MVRNTALNLQERARIHVAPGDPPPPAVMDVEGDADRARGDLPRRLALTPGTHLTPDDGACLMEVVSHLAGEQWSDEPRATLPLLAHLARLVNDAMTPGGRQSLLALAPRLTGLASAGPSIQPRIAAMVSGAALEWHPSPVLAWMHRAALRHVALAEQPERPLAGLRRRLYVHGPAQRAIEASVAAALAPPRWHAPRAGSAPADRRLLSLLERAVELVEGHAVGDGGVQRGASKGVSTCPEATR